MTDDKTLWILVNNDFSGGATVGYRLDAGEPVAEHEFTFQWTVPAEALVTGKIPNGVIEIAMTSVISHVLHAPLAQKVDARGVPQMSGVHVSHPIDGTITDSFWHIVPAHVVGRAVALANRVIARNKAIAFAESMTW